MVDLKNIKNLLKLGDIQRVESLLKELPKKDFVDKIIHLQKVINKIPSKTDSVCIGLIGGSTLYPLSEYLKAFLFREGVHVSLYCGEFSNYKQEILDTTSWLYKEKLDLLIVFPDDIINYVQPNISSEFEVVNSSLQAFVEETNLLLEHYHKEKPCSQVILLNRALITHHDFGPNIRNSSLGSYWNLSKKYNELVAQQKKSWYELVDVEFLSAKVGASNVYDSKFELETKNIYSNNFLIEIADEISFVVSSNKKPIKKVLVCDLDNTLWGGVIGDDGVEGIALDEISARGTAFKNLQRYIKSLMDLGVILAINSKNEESVAREAFETHPDMILQWDDFVSKKVNWNPKSDNIKLIAEELNLGLDSFVFIDDNLAEIEIVKRFVPEVETVTMNGDPSDFIQKLAERRFFEPKEITDEDRDKTTRYKVELKRKESKIRFTNINEYLESLLMEVDFKKFEPVFHARISQLTQKSNQFNLTTIRRSVSEIEDLANDSSIRTISTHLKDKFGDYGLVGVNILRLENDSLVIDTWLMSCRVLKRGVEDEILNKIIQIAKDNGKSRVVGVYIPTAKNVIVKDMYSHLGFTKVGDTEEQGTKYELLVEGYQDLETKINVI